MVFSWLLFLWSEKKDKRRRCDSSQAGDEARSAESLQTRTK